MEIVCNLWKMYVDFCIVTNDNQSVARWETMNKLQLCRKRCDNDKRLRQYGEEFSYSPSLGRGDRTCEVILQHVGITVVTPLQAQMVGLERNRKKDQGPTP